MSSVYTPTDILNAIAAASEKLSARKNEINRLNVFPVPDGDTGTNMSLTIESVVTNISQLPKNPDAAAIRKAITNGALMGARGNSGVITSQILRGLCEGSVDAEEFDTDTIAKAFDHAVEVAFQAVRKPVEGTILTVLKDSAAAADKAARDGLDTDDAMQAIVEEAYASVNRTPDLLPVLKENGVVDSGGYGLAIFIDAFASALMGKEGTLGDSLAEAHVAEPKVEIEHIMDWEGANYRYCNEFLVKSDTLVKEDALNFLQTMGDCELCVGDIPNFKVHVHSNHPDQVLKYFLDRGQIYEVYIHNMDIQAVDRRKDIAEHELEEEQEQQQAEHKNIGFVAVAAGDGNADILKSLGVDVVVSGGQTMNPSTKDILDAMNKVNADGVIVMPDNKNIIMAAQSACSLFEKPCGVVPTKSVPQAFAAMFAATQDASVDENVSQMTDAFADVKTGEITTAIKDSVDSHDNKIKEGDIMGIVDGSIDVVGNDLDQVAMDTLAVMDADDADTLTILAGADYDDDHLNALVDRIQEKYPDLEIDSHDGGQPLYPLILSTE